MAMSINYFAKAVVLFGAVAAGILASPVARAEGGPPDKPGYDNCIGPGLQGNNQNMGHRTCSRTNHSFTAGGGGDFPGRCNGELGYWTIVPMPNGKVFCVAKLTDFFHGPTDSPTCTVDVYKGNSNNLEESATVPGVCP